MRVYLWRQLTKTSPRVGRARGVARRREKNPEIQQLLVLRQPGSETLGGRARMCGSRCLCVSLSIPLMREASLRDVDAAFGGAILHWLDQTPAPHPTTTEDGECTQNKRRRGWAA